MDASENHIDFASILAFSVHDAKNSLSLLLSTLDEILSHCAPLSCPSYRQFSQLQYEANCVNNNLIQLLTLYKMDNSQYPLNISHLSIYEFIDEYILEIKPLFDFKGIKIEEDFHEDIFWFFDGDLISVVLNNVFNNAVRFTNGKIKVSAQEDNGYLVMTIEDDGEGYPDHMLASKTQAMKGISLKTGSTGLGLYFSDMVARLHKNRGKEGFISMRNGGAYGGACFSISIP